MQAWPFTSGVAGLQVVALLRLPATATLISLAAVAAFPGLPGRLRVRVTGSADQSTSNICQQKLTMTDFGAATVTVAAFAMHQLW